MSLEVLFWRNPHLSLLFIAHLPSQLPDTVNELNKNRGAVGICVVLIAVSNTLKDMIHLRTISDETRQAPTFFVTWNLEGVWWKVCLPAGSGDQNSAILSQAAPRNHEWFGNNRPAWAWPRRWADSCGPNRHCSAPPLRFFQTPPCLQSAALLPESAINTQMQHVHTKLFLR